MELGNQCEQPDCLWQTRSVDLTLPQKVQDRMNAPEFTEARILEMVAGVKAYLKKEREVYVRHSEPLTPSLRQVIDGFFSAEVLDKLKTITLTGGARIPPPPFYLKAKEMSGGKFPDFVHMDSITYIDVTVFHDRILPRALFHGAVH